MYESPKRLFNVVLLPNKTWITMPNGIVNKIAAITKLRGFNFEKCHFQIIKNATIIPTNDTTKSNIDIPNTRDFLRLLIY